MKLKNICATLLIAVGTILSSFNNVSASTIYQINSSQREYGYPRLSIVGQSAPQNIVYCYDYNKTQPLDQQVARPTDNQYQRYGFYEGMSNLGSNRGDQTKINQVAAVLMAGYPNNALGEQLDKLAEESYANFSGKSSRPSNYSLDEFKREMTQQAIWAIDTGNSSWATVNSYANALYQYALKYPLDQETATAENLKIVDSNNNPITSLKINNSTLTSDTFKFTGYNSVLTVDDLPGGVSLIDNSTKKSTNVMKENQLYYVKINNSNVGQTISLNLNYMTLGDSYFYQPINTKYQNMVQAQATNEKINLQVLSGSLLSSSSSSKSSSSVEASSSKSSSKSSSNVEASSSKSSSKSSSSVEASSSKSSSKSSSSVEASSSKSSSKSSSSEEISNSKNSSSVKASSSKSSSKSSSSEEISSSLSNSKNSSSVKASSSKSSSKSSSSEEISSSLSNSKNSSSVKASSSKSSSKSSSSAEASSSKSSLKSSSSEEISSSLSKSKNSSSVKASSSKSSLKSSSSVEASSSKSSSKSSSSEVSSSSSSSKSSSSVEASSSKSSSKSSSSVEASSSKSSSKSSSSAEASSSSLSSNNQLVAKTTKSSSSNNKENKSGCLPKTGENKDSIAILLGLFLLAIGSFMYIKKVKISF